MRALWLHDPADPAAVGRGDEYLWGADMLVASRRRVYFLSGMTHGCWTFLRTYILRAGFLDGPEGFLVARYHAQTTFYRYMKAWMKQRRGELK